MRVFRNFTTALTFTTIVALAILSSGCEYVNKVIAKDKLNQGAIKYNGGLIREAQQYFKEATERDQRNPIAWLYYGATLVKDYQAVEDEGKKKEIANQALEVYKKALDLAGDNCKTKDNAISYIATIYDDLGNKEENRNWLLKRTEPPCTTKEVQAVTYYTIAVKYWTCSYDQTKRYQDKAKYAKEPFHYRNMDYSPEALADKKMAEDCVTKGLYYIEKALEVDPEYIDALYYKGLLYRERQMMTKDEAKRRELDSMAQKLNEQASALQKKREAAAQQQQPAPQAANK